MFAIGDTLCAAAIPGDANYNGFLDVGDLIVVTSYLFFGGPSPRPCVLAGDINSDGQVDIADMIGLLAIF